MKRHNCRRKANHVRVPSKWAGMPGRLVRSRSACQLVIVSDPADAQPGDLLLPDRFMQDFDRVIGRGVTVNARGYHWRLEPWCVSHGWLALRPLQTVAEAPRARALRWEMDREEFAADLALLNPVRIEYPRWEHGRLVNHVWYEAR